MDLRTIPWVISYLYGGLPAGIIITIAMLIYREVLGGAGTYIVFIVYTLTSIPFFYIIDYHLLIFNKKIKFTLLITLINTCLVAVLINWVSQLNYGNHFKFDLFYIALHLLTMFITVYIIEVFHENERLQQELHKAEKLNIVGEMAASVAHEIRNPMTTIKGFLQLMSKDHVIPLKHREHFSLMEEELKRAEKIINDYLTLAKPVAEKLEKLDLKKQIKNMNLTLTTFAVMHDVILESKISNDENYYIKGNPDKIQQVLVNIIKNAIEVSSKGTVVQVLLSKENQVIQIAVKDKGIGMSEEEIQRLGTPFYSLKHNGTGLGLTVCYKIIQSMGGKIEVKSKKNCGTTFTVLLPEYKH